METPLHLAKPLSFGIEEEFFLIDPATRDLARKLPEDFFRQCRRALGSRVGEEMLRPQVEISTPVMHDAPGARDHLLRLRRELSSIASSCGLALVAAGTHPFADWLEQQHTDKPRYARLVQDFQIVGRRNLLCGLHVHVGIPAGFDRVKIMNRVMPFVPYLLALSTSSPFWSGQRTGLLSYRQAAYDEWPRSGIPDAFESEVEYDAFVRLLASCGAVDDGSHLWWAVRPSARYPTLELRIADACTHVEDSLAIASLFRCLVRAHLRDGDLGTQRTSVSRRIVDENRWRAKRYGTEAEFIDEATATTVGFARALEELTTLIEPDVRALECEGEIEHLRTIVRRGTSAHTQLAIYRAQRNQCRTRSEALASVVDWLARTSAVGPREDAFPTPACQSSRDMVMA